MKDSKALPSYVYQRNSIYYYRIRIPHHLKSLFNRSELRASLHTSYKRLATKRAAVLTATIDTFFKELTRKPMNITQAKIRELLQGHTKEQLDYDEAYRRDKARDWDEVDLETNVVSSYLDRYSEALTLNQYRPIESEVKRFISEKKLPIEKTSEHYKLLCREYAKSQVEVLSVVLARAEGDYSQEAAYAEKVDKENSTKSSNASITSYTFQELVDKFAAEAALTEAWTEKTREENLRIYTLFKRIIGDIDIKEINHDTVGRYKDVLIKLPANMNKIAQFRDKSIEEILEMSDVKPMAANTINKNIGRMSSLLKWATRHGLIDQNYAEGITLKKTKRADQERQVYTSDTLRVLFNENTIYSKNSFKEPYQFWLPLLGLFTGARLNELCQLYLDDIQQDKNGTWFIDINETLEDKKLKSLASKRQVALHPILLEIGLLEFVDKLRSSNGKRLFPELKHQRDGYGTSASKWFGRLREKLGIYKKGLDFHSFRHTLSNNLYENDVPVDVVSDIIGHDEGHVTRRYTKRLTPTTQLSSLMNLHYDINFTHIRFYSL